MTRLFARKRRAGRNDEQGSVLVIALVFVVIMSIFGVIVLDQVASAPNIQSTYANVRTTTLNSDAATDAAIQAIRFDSTNLSGVSAYAGGNGPCSNQAQYTQLGTGTYQVNSGDTPLTVWCKPDKTSGALAGVAANVPPNAIVALGGMSNTLSNTYATSTNPDKYYPFCTDWMNPGNSRCESAVFVGRGVQEAANDTGGLYLGSTGALHPGATVVSNGAVVVSTVNQPARTLSAAGAVNGYRACQGWNNSSNKPWPNPGYLDSVIQNYGASNQGDASCPASSLTPDPLYVHEPFDPMQLPRVDAAAAAPYTLSTALCGNGFVTMPAMLLPKQQTYVDANGVTQNVNVYGAWYDNARDLNVLMQNCPDTLFYFRPGIYYFDFLDQNNEPNGAGGVSGGPTKWISTKACWPVTDTCGSSEVFGGLYSDGTMPTWGVQPAKVMITNKNTTTGKWTNVAASTDLDGPDLGPDGLTSTDNGVATTSLSNGNGTSASLAQNNLQTPLPQTAGTYDSTYAMSVKFEIGYSLPSSASYYKADTNDPVGGGGALLAIQLNGKTASGGNATGNCYLHLTNDTAGGHDYIDTTSEPFRAMATNDGVSTGEVIDLSNGCPAGGSSTGTWAAGNFSWTPSMVNQLKATFTVHTYSTVKSPNAAIAKVDGMQYAVTWKGRPAPSFPNGCDNSRPGVQFVLGSDSRIDWGGSGHDMFAELCASRQDTFPNWMGSPARANTWSQPNNADYTSGPGHDYAIALYALTDTSATQPADAPPITTDMYSTCNSGCDTTTIQNATNASSSVIAMTPWNNAVSIDGNVASAQFTTTKSASVAFTLPTNLVCAQTTLGSNASGSCDLSKQIPYASTITDVSLTVKHREGDTGVAGCNGGGFCPNNGAGINYVRIAITKGSSSSSNGFTAGNWTTANNNGILSTSGNDLPTCTTTALCTYTYGDNTLSNDTDAVSGNLATSSAPGGWQLWTYQRDLTDDLSTPEAINGATITYTVKGANDGNTHQADLDGIVLTIKYRKTGTLRPVRGCMTTRTELPPGYFLPATNDPSGIKANLGYDWLDTDWGVNKASNSNPYNTDNPFTDFQNAPNAGIGSGSDANDCAAFDVDTGNGLGMKMHFQGMIYTPSAALYLTGNDNDSSWSTDGIVARSITAFRWKNGGDTPGVGGSRPQRNSRKLAIEVCDSSGNPNQTNTGHCLLRMIVAFDDGKMQTLGNGFTIDSWVRNPS